MKKFIYIIFSIIITSIALDVHSIWKFNPLKIIDKRAQCYDLYWKLEDPKIKATETIGVTIWTDNFIAVQDGELLNINFIDKREGYSGYSIKWISWDTSVLKDNDPVSLLQFNPLYSREILIHFNSIIHSPTLKFIFIDSSSFYEKKFYYSIDDINYLPFDHFDLNKYTFTSIKIVYEEKKEKREEDKEIISISEIMFKDMKNFYAVSPISNAPIEFMSGNTCTGNEISPLDTKLEVWSDALRVDINLIKRESYDTEKDIQENKTPTSSKWFFPPIDTIVLSMIAFLMTLSIAMYIRKNAKIKNERGIIPQDIFWKGKKTKNYDKLYQAFNLTAKKLKHIASIESVEMTISNSKKKKIITSKHLIKILWVLFSHYEENKNTFLAWELRDIYSSVIESFSKDLDKKEHEKALSFIDDFIEKWWKLVINKKVDKK